MPAFNAVEEVFAAFPFLSELGPEMYSILVTGIQNNDPADVIISNIRQSSVYRTRFAGMEARQKANLPAISEAEYLDLERGYRNQLREFTVDDVLGLNVEETFRKFAAQKIGEDVSVAELNRRLDRAQGLASDAAPFVQQAFEQFYGVQVTDNALMAYFLDAERGMSEIEDQLAAAVIGSEALSRGLQINRTRSEILRREGVTADLAREGFSDIAQETPVLSRLAQIHNITPLGQEDLEDFFFHQDPNVAARRNRIFTQSLAAFQGGGSAPSTTREGGLEQFVDRNRTF